MPAPFDRFLRMLIVSLLTIAPAACVSGKTTDVASNGTPRPSADAPQGTIAPEAAPSSLPTPFLPAASSAAPPATDAPSGVSASHPLTSPTAASPGANASDAVPPEADAASAALPGTKPAAPLAETPFDAQRPSLNGIALGTPMRDVERLHGRPADRYLLPDGDRLVDMAEYDGFSVGYAGERTVYVEVFAPGVPTGIPGLAVGQSAADAAQALGLETADSSSNVLAVRVAGGLLKADLDPESRKVVSIRLIGEN